MPDGPALPLTAEEEKALLAVARAAIHERLYGDGSLHRVRTEHEGNEALSQRAAAFVTLETQDRSEPSDRLRLRGCIGTLEAREPLVDCVAHNAVQAAFLDPRFPPLRAEELPAIVVSVSVLTAPAPVTRPEAIVLGTDGVIFTKGRHRSVFLPQVAVEQGWDLRALLEHLALKAGLDQNEWPGARLETFRAASFREPFGGSGGDAI